MLQLVAISSQARTTCTCWDAGSTGCIASGSICHLLVAPMQEDLIEAVREAVEEKLMASCGNNSKRTYAQVRTRGAAHQWARPLDDVQITRGKPCW